MILGASHVTLLSKEIKRDGEELKKLGYSMSFIEEHIPNHNGKYRFLGRPSVNHSLSLYQHRTGTPIELIMYEDCVEGGSSCFEALFDGNPPEALLGDLRHPETKDGLNMFGYNLSPFFWDAFRTGIWFKGGPGQDNGLKSLIVFVKVLKKAQKFFENGLGCKPLRGGQVSERPWLLENFRSPVSAWNLDIILIEDLDYRKEATLDGIGFNCLAFITTNLKLDRFRLLDSGVGESTGEFELIMNNKHLMVEVFRGPDGEFIELLQVMSVKEDD